MGNCNLKQLQEQFAPVMVAGEWTYPKSVQVGNVSEVDDALAELAALQARLAEAQAQHTCPYCGVGLHHTSAVHRCAGPSVTVVTPELVAERTRAEKAEAQVAEALELLRDHYDGAPDSPTRWVAAVIAVLEGEQP